MIRDIVHDPLFLGMPSMPATEEDLPVAADLLETLQANAERCVGMAANMIGVRKRIIVFNDDGKYTVMINPEVVRKSGKYIAEEGCLSLEGVRKTERYAAIRIRYTDMQMKTREKSWTGFPAQIIQHELDHCNGILI